MNIGFENGEALIGEAHAVDDGFVFRIAEDAGLWVAVLWFWGDGAGFGETEIHFQDGCYDFGVFIEARSKADGVFESEAEKFLL